MTARILAYDGVRPCVAPEAFVADGATLVGSVIVATGASVWFGAVVRGDGAPIAIGEDSNIQDGAVLHSDPDFPVITWTEDNLGRAIFYYEGRDNGRFLTVHT